MHPEANPSTRTVGQLVADAIRLYGERFWRALLIGVGPALLMTVVLSRRAHAEWVILMSTAGGVLLSASFVTACLLVAGRPWDRHALLAIPLGVVLFAPFALLLYPFVLPAIAWLALVGLAVPVLVLERAGVRAAVRRGVRLALADYVHALGSLATLFIVCVLSVGLLLFLLRETGEQSLRIAGFLAINVVSPLLFLGAALLYFDQVARHDLRDGPPVPQR